MSQGDQELNAARVLSYRRPALFDFLTDHLLYLGLYCTEKLRTILRIHNIIIELSSPVPNRVFLSALRIIAWFSDHLGPNFKICSIIRSAAPNYNPFDDAIIEITLLQGSKCEWTTRPQVSSTCTSTKHYPNVTYPGCHELANSLTDVSGQYLWNLLIRNDLCRA
ncbi:hypothetical protein BDV36DRAFT_272386 [Aspergillus pseudocaelatus]|uniref:Uncharacterized protein n=1 Tax=Aspergillus pseudocaelatus TaxID=1825620 RepID=A0ABQ6W4R6_9EURO|nr:hypothetical protein BDV36DRAFT_272386 [Aspergillus pseudocaelatus]